MDMFLNLIVLYSLNGCIYLKRQRHGGIVEFL